MATCKENTFEEIEPTTDGIFELPDPSLEGKVDIRRK